MSDTLREYWNDFVMVYFDDIKIFPSLETRWEHVQKVLRKLKEKRINLKVKNANLRFAKTKYLGHVVNGKNDQNTGRKD